ncbi:MAG: hypothetical protein R3245_07740 [Kiloniellales bacterium]|nr:hypothetical protein [Kiloniellales bacterium]
MRSLLKGMAAIIFAIFLTHHPTKSAIASDLPCQIPLKSVCLFSLAQDLAENLVPAHHYIGQVAVAWTELGEVDEARKVIASVPTFSPDRDDLLRRMAVASAEQGAPDTMSSLLDEIGSARTREIALREASVALARAGFVDEARRHLPKFHLPEDRATLLAALGAAEDAAGRKEAADRDFEEARASLRSGETALSSLGIALAQAGRFDAAKEIITRLSPGTALYAVQVALVNGYLRNERLHEAVQVASEIDNAGLENAAYLKIYTWLVERGDLKSSRLLAQEKLGGVDDRKTRISRARAFAKNGLIEEAMETSAGLSDQDRSSVLYAIARYRLANEEIEAAVDAVPTIAHGRLRQDLLRLIALSHLSEGREEAALASVLQIEVERMRLNALLDLAKQRGLDEKAR